jgi:hypothetical protein
MKNYQNQLWSITIALFILSFVNIAFISLGIICFIVPFVQYLKYKEQIWCQYFCPRAGFFTKIFKNIGLKKPLPKWLRGERLKEIVIYYFIINLSFILMSSVMVFLGRIPPIEELRILIVIGTSLKVFQLMLLELSPLLLHFSYRMLSVMVTSISIGSILGFIYAPRTWCIICPVMTLTTKKQ